jgi:hypothetical protein
VDSGMAPVLSNYGAAKSPGLHGTASTFNIIPVNLLRRDEKEKKIRYEIEILKSNEPTDDMSRF